MTPTPLRGEVWDAGTPRLAAIHCVLITGHAGPPNVRIILDSDAGLTRYDISYADTTTLLTIPKGSLQKRWGRLALSELERIEQAVRTVLGLP